MDYEELSELNKEFADMTVEMNREFLEIFQKWLKKSPRLASVNSIHLPLNLILSLIDKDEENILPKIVDDLPMVFLKFAYPFTKLKDKWGKISGKEFVKLYGEEHSKLYSKFFKSEEERENFARWFEADKKKHKRRI